MLALSELHKKNALSVKKRAKIRIIFGISNSLINFTLKHLPLLEDAEDDDSGDRHQCKCKDPRPSRLSEPAEPHIHSEEAGNECRRHEHQRDKGKHLHDLVLVEVDDTEDSVLKIFKSFKTEIGMVDERGYVLQEDIQLRMIFYRILLAFDDA